MENTATRNVAGGSLAGGERPRRHHGMGLRVDRANDALVLDVHVDPAELRVVLGELGFAIERDGGHDRAGLRVEYGGVLAATVEGVDLLAIRFVEDGVGIGSGLDLGDERPGIDRDASLRGA